MKKNRGTAMLLSYLVIVVLLITASIFVMRTINEKNFSYRFKESKEAFNLAEAGINMALIQLRQDYDYSGGSSVNLGRGQYSVSIANILPDKRQIISSGFIPSSANFRSKRGIEAVVRKYIPPNFYDNAIYTAGELDLNGNAYAVNGDVIYGEEEVAGNTQNITGTITQDTSINPLAGLNFQQLYQISQSQGNVYDEARLDDVKKGTDSFPASFWYSPPSDPNDPATGVPNVVYIEGDLTLNGNIGTIGGLFVVVGDVLTNPLGTYDATINGNGMIDGFVYTRGEFQINGGGGGLNVNGGVWAGEEAELNGNATVSYNQDYADAIRALDIDPGIQIVSWRET